MQRRWSELFTWPEAIGIFISIVVVAVIGILILS